MSDWGSILGTWWHRHLHDDPVQVCGWRYPEQIVDLTDGSRLHVGDLFLNYFRANPPAQEEGL